MPAYYVTLNREKVGMTLPEGADSLILFADDATMAKQLAQAHFSFSDAHWNSGYATVTEVAAASDWNGWTFRVTVAPGESSQIQVTKVADATDNTIDEIAAALVVLLNATSIDNAAYNSTTQVLTVAGAADALGDKELKVEIIPPNGFDSVASLVGTIVDAGSSGDAVTVVLPADADAVPKLYGKASQR